MTRETTTGSSSEQFRKFCVGHFTYLKYYGLWSKFDSNVSTFLRGLYYVYNKFILMIIYAFSATIFADICLNFDLMSVTDVGSIFTGLILAVFKITIFQTRSDRIIRLLHESIDSCNQLCKFPIGNENEILDKYLLACRIIFYTFSVMAFCLGIGVLFLAPVEKGQLPIKAQYPFNTTVHPWHGIGYSFEVYTSFLILMAIVRIESLIINLCSMFLVQFAILNMHFKTCGNGQHDAMSNGIDKRDSLDITIRNTCYGISSTIKASCGKDNYDPDVIRRGGFDEQFGRSIRNHQRLLAIVNDYNEIFSSCFFVQMFSSTSMICLTCFQFTLVVGQSSNAFKIIANMVPAVSELFCMCWIGNEVMHQSALLMTSQWFGNWNDELSTKTGRLLILSLMFSKRTIILKAGPLFNLSIETFIMIMKYAYSFFTLLSTMNFKDQ